MLDFLNRYVFITDAYPNQGNRVKALFLYAIIGIFAFFVPILGIIGTFNGITFAPVAVTGLLITLLTVFGLLRTGRLEVASWFIVIVLGILIQLNNITVGTLEIRALLNSTLLMIIAGFLLDTRGIVVVTFYAIAQLFLYPAITGVDSATSNVWVTRISLAITYSMTAVVIYAFNQFVAANRQEGEAIGSRDRLKLADVTMQITRQAATRTSLDDALNNVLDLILKNYPQLYHAQVFLLDETGIRANLVASTGDVGQILLERQHNLTVGSLSVIGQVTLTGNPVVAIANDAKSVHKVNELLPETTLEAAFALQVEGNIIGALDLQSKTLTALSDDDRISFESLANSLALAIDNIRQFEASQERIEENERLTERTRSMLSEVERLNRRLIGRAWNEYTKEHADELGFEIIFDQQDGTFTPYNEWSSTLQEAMERGDITQRGRVVSIPLRVRGEVVGAMEFELDEVGLRDEDLTLIEEVVERFGLAAENTRLVEESQRTAHRETLINQMTSRFQAAQNVETTLAEAARSLSETLSADKVAIRLGLPETPSTNGHENGGNR